MDELFRKFSRNTVNKIGSAWGFIFGAAIILIWLLTGLYFEYSPFWQSLFNLGIAVVTFMLLFVIQHKQNRDSAAINIKLDELILSSKNARNSVIDAENLSDKELDEEKEHLIHHKNKKNT